MAWHPPFSRQILFEIAHTKQDTAKDIALKIKKKLIEHWKQKEFLPKEIRLAGPYEAALEKLNGEYRFQICLHFVHSIHPKNILPKDFWEEKLFKKTLKIDVDPISFL